MINTVNSITLNDTKYQLQQDNGSLVQQVSQIQSDLIRLESALNALNIKIPVDETINSLSPNAVSNQAVATQLTELSRKIRNLEENLAAINTSGFITNDQVINQLANQQQIIDSGLSKTSTNAVQNSTITQELISLKSQINSLQAYFQGSFVTKEDLQDNIIYTDSSLSTTSRNPIQNKVVTKELQSIKNDIANLANTSQTSSNIQMQFSNNTVYINNQPLFTFTELENAFKISVLNGQKTYTINTGSGGSLSKTSVIYNPNNKELDITFGDNSGAFYSSSNQTLTLL